MTRPAPGGQTFRYVIEVVGVVDCRWSEWFDDVEVTILPSQDDPHCTTLIAYLPDQSALPGLLARVTGLNLKVLSVTPQPSTDGT